jgi:hypothetical protein
MTVMAEDFETLPQHTVLGVMPKCFELSRKSVAKLNALAQEIILLLRN